MWIKNVEKTGKFEKTVKIFFLNALYTNLVRKKEYSQSED